MPGWSRFCGPVSAISCCKRNPVIWVTLRRGPSVVACTCRLRFSAIGRAVFEKRGNLGAVVVRLRPPWRRARRAPARGCKPKPSKFLSAPGIPWNETFPKAIIYGGVRQRSSRKSAICRAQVRGLWSTIFGKLVGARPVLSLLLPGGVAGLSR